MPRMHADLTFQTPPGDCKNKSQLASSTADDIGGAKQKVKLICSVVSGVAGVVPRQFLTTTRLAARHGTQEEKSERKGGGASRGC